MGRRLDDSQNSVGGVGHDSIRADMLITESEEIRFERDRAPGLVVRAWTDGQPSTELGVAAYCMRLHFPNSHRTAIKVPLEHGTVYAS